MSSTLLARLTGIRDLLPEWREASPVSDFYRPCELLARGLAF
jgi:hypothetical protein